MCDPDLCPGFPPSNKLGGKLACRSVEPNLESSFTKAAHVSNEKKPGWLGYIRDYTTQLYRDYNKPL